MLQYYDGTKLLSMKDLNGNTPELYLVTTNRTGGKTTYFGRLCLNRFLKTGEKFALLYRFNYELDDIAEKFFKDISALFFPDYVMTSKSCAKGIYHELYLQHVGSDDLKNCGYAISLNSADQIKKYSHLFSDVQRILFDEFQSENNHYCSEEIRKFISVHTSIARGQGKQYRPVPVFMLSNPVSILNPYYIALGITDRLKKDTKFLKGNGYILEQGYVESAHSAQKESGFNQAFASDPYIAYSLESVYLNDNESFIEKPPGSGRYLATFVCDGVYYALREYPAAGIIYADDHPDLSNPYKISVTTDDHQINYVMLKKNDMFIKNMRFYFERGSFRFKDLKCKSALLKMISY